MRKRTKEELPPEADEIRKLAERLVAFIDSLSDFEFKKAETHQHMGALLADAVLQAGINYNTVVRPKLEHLRVTYPNADTTSAFLEVLEEHGSQAVVGFKPGDKPETLAVLCSLLINEKIETAEELRSWLARPGSREKLQGIKWIGPKTASYIGILCGSPDEVAIDIHLRDFLQLAGVEAKSDQHAQQIYVRAARLLDKAPADLDHSVWSYMTARRREIGPGTRRCAHAEEGAGDAG